MTNAELISMVRSIAKHGADWRINEVLNRAADALEAAEKRIKELEAQKPNRGEWIEKWRFKTDGTPFHKIGDMECSVCHGDMLGRYYSKYCPHCGALLRGENDERTDKA